MLEEKLLLLKQQLEKNGKLTEISWEEISKIFIIKKINKGDYFSKEGEHRRRIAFVLSGILRLYYLTENGIEHNKHFFVEDNFLLSSLEPEEKESIINIQSLETTMLLSASYNDFINVCEKHVCLDKIYKKMLFKYLEKKQFREIQLLSLNATGKYEYFLKEYGFLLSKIPHYHIASYLGITPTQLSRIRSKKIR